VAAGADAKKAANWIQNDVARLLDAESNGHVVKPEHLAELIKLVDGGTLGISSARALLPDVVSSGKAPSALVQERGLTQVSDMSAIEAAAHQAIEANAAAVADYKAGKATAINFLKGQVMKATRGQANPAVAEEVLKRLLA
jgi:aspartyl-tRNA(Asn)/glutamyl-tRNA(Gln) amidotransferase subunit B